MDIDPQGMTTHWRRLGAFRRAVGRLLEAAVIVVMAALVLDVVWQVFSRYVLSTPCAWSEELARMLLIWLALLGAAVGFGRQAHLGVDYLVDRLRPRSRAATEMVAHGLTGLFAAAVMVYGGTRIVHATLATNQVSASLGIRMGYVYLALPLSGLFILLYSLEMVLKNAAAASQAELENE